MALDKNHRAIRRMFLHHQYMVRSDDSSRYTEHASRSDMVVIKYGLSIAVECKFGDQGSFDFKGWKVEQRDWAMNFCEAHPYGVPYWVALSVSPKRVAGDHISDRVETPTWLVPFQVLHDLHRDCYKIYGSHTIRLEVGKGHNKSMQQDSFDLLTKLAKYRVECIPQGEAVYPDSFGDKAGQPYNHIIYVIPENHQFNKDLDQRRISL